MGRWNNLEDPPISNEQRRTRDLEGAAPIGFSSVTRGGLRIASEEGLSVEGTAVVTGTLKGARTTQDKSALLDWNGDARFKWNVLVDNQFVSGKSTFLNGRLDLNDGLKLNIFDAKVGASNIGDLKAGMYVVGCEPDGSKLGLYKVPTLGGTGGPPAGTGTVMDPLPGHYDALDPFGNIRPSGIPHSGSDWNGLPEGTYLPAMAGGTVVYEGWQDGNGWGVHVRMDRDGLYYAYIHMQERSNKRVGDRVAIGDYIGKLGNTGYYSFGAHLHVSVSDTPMVWGGNLRDPWAYINAG